MILLQNATKYYKTKHGKKYVLKNVSLKLPENKNIGILGINGAGKSTLLRMLGGIDFPNSGKIISDKTFSWPMGLAGGFQGSMTGRQNVRFVARVFGQDEEEIKKIVNFVYEFSELGEYFDMPIKTYSSGMKSRLSFGLSLAFDFDYLLIDETLSVGDSRFKAKSKEALMKKIEKSNVLMVSHSMKDLRDICDVGIVLHEGKLYYFDNIEDAIKTYEDINKKGIINAKPCNLIYGAEEKVKNYLSYRLGESLIKCFKVFFILCPVVYPLVVLGILLEKDRNGIPLSKYSDKERGERLKEHLSYKLGQKMIELYKENFLNIFRLPLELYKVYKDHKKRRHGKN